MCENKDFCGTGMSSKENMVLYFNQYQNSDKPLAIIYVDIESFIKKNIEM